MKSNLEQRLENFHAHKNALTIWGSQVLCPAPAPTRGACKNAQQGGVALCLTEANLFGNVCGDITNTQAGISGETVPEGIY